MKYQLPENIKNFDIYCQDIRNYTNYFKCTRNCKKANICDVSYINNCYKNYFRKECWKTKIKLYILDACSSANYQNAITNYVCPRCNNQKFTKINDDIPPQMIKCEYCGYTSILDEILQKQILQSYFLEIDFEELNYILDFEQKKFIKKININNNITNSFNNIDNHNGSFIIKKD